MISAMPREKELSGALALGAQPNFGRNCSPQEGEYCGYAFVTPSPERRLSRSPRSTTKRFGLFPVRALWRLPSGQTFSGHLSHVGQKRDSGIDVCIAPLYCSTQPIKELVIYSIVFIKYIVNKSPKPTHHIMLIFFRTKPQKKNPL